jgi:hypothetical protein
MQKSQVSERHSLAELLQCCPTKDTNLRISMLGHVRAEQVMAGNCATRFWPSLMELLEPRSGLGGQGAQTNRPVHSRSGVVRALTPPLLPLTLRVDAPKHQGVTRVPFRGACGAAWTRRPAGRPYLAGIVRGQDPTFRWVVLSSPAVRSAGTAFSSGTGFLSEYGKWGKGNSSISCCNCHRFNGCT